jgi:hypothetical protein
MRKTPVTVVCAAVVYLSAACQRQPAPTPASGQNAQTAGSQPENSSATAVNPPLRQVEGWSEQVNGLQARLRLVDKGRQNGKDWLVPYLELRNVRDLGSAMEVNLDARHLQVELVDEEGKPLGLRPRPAHTGGVVSLGTITLPRDSAIRISLETRGWVVPRDAAAIVDTRHDAFAIFEQEKGKVFLRATVTAEKTETSPEWKRWIGTIHTPLLKVDW